MAEAPALTATEPRPNNGAIAASVALAATANTTPPHDGHPPPATGTPPHARPAPAHAAAPHTADPPANGIAPHAGPAPANAAAPHTADPPGNGATPYTAEPPANGAAPHTAEPPATGIPPHAGPAPANAAAPHTSEPPANGATPCTAEPPANGATPHTADPPANGAAPQTAPTANGIPPHAANASAPHTADPPAIGADGARAPRVGPPAWTALPGDDGRLARAERAWRARREALERELAGAAQALARVRDDERMAREAIRAARADLRAVRAARAADASALAILSAELEAERIAHAVSRATAARLAADLFAARAELAKAAATPRRLDIQRRAHAQAQVAAQSPPPPNGRLIADLEAAAAALRRAAPPPDHTGSPPAGGDDRERPAIDPTEAPAESAPTEGSAPAAGGAPERRLRKALVAFAEQDPVAAGRLLVALLPAQAAVLDGPISYDLTVRGLGTFAVSVQDGGADVRPVEKPRPRAEALFHLRVDAFALAELLAGERRRIGRFRGRARATGKRRRTAGLAPLVATRLSLADAVRAGALLEPELVYPALPFAVEPEWTRGHSFTVAQEILDPSPRSWYLTARDGDRLAVSEHPPTADPDATVAMSRAAFAALLRGESPAAGERPAVRGDHAAVAALKAWTDRAAGR